MGKVYVGDHGTRVLVHTGSDISGATVHLKVRKPNNVAVTWTGIISGTEDIAHTLDRSEIDVAGEYLVQAYVHKDGWEGRGQTAVLRVHNIFR
jgi:hypothetical protein